MRLEIEILLAVSGVLGSIFVIAIIDPSGRKPKQSGSVQEVVKDGNGKSPSPIYYPVKKWFHNYCTKHKEQRTKNPTEWGLTRPTWVMAIFTGILICVGISQCVELKEQQQALQQTLNELQAEQRPWIKPLVQLASVKFTPELDAQISFSTAYENVGKSPPRRIFLDTTVIAPSKVDLFSSYRVEANECEVAKGYGVAPHDGMFLFPNEATSDDPNGGLRTKTVKKSEYEKVVFPAPNRPMFMIVGCIVYQLSADPN